MSFPCTECGACCRKAAHEGLMPSLDGRTCIFQHELEDGRSRCLIYDDRPEVCRITTNYEANAMACGVLQEAEGLSEEWLPKLSPHTTGTHDEETDTT